MGKKSTASAKHWCFTSYKSGFNFDNINKEKITYCIYGVEQCPETNRTHYQGFVSFKNRTTLLQAKQSIGDQTAHFEIKRGSIQEAADYCRKDGRFEQWGIQPEEQTAGLKRGAGIDYEEVDRLAKQGKFEEICSEGRIKYWGNLKKIYEHEAALANNKVLLPGSICGLWLFGPPGVGKTFFCRQLCAMRGLSSYVKMHNKWWDGYRGEEVVIIEDIDHSTCKALGHFLKEWVDEAPFPAETKGGFTRIRPLQFIITSNYTIEQLWPEDLNLRDAIKRRFYSPIINCREDFGLLTLPEELSLIKNGVQKEIQIPSSSVQEEL